LINLDRRNNHQPEPDWPGTIEPSIRANALSIFVVGWYFVAAASTVSFMLYIEDKKAIQ
jgi:hypothetical protein